MNNGVSRRSALYAGAALLGVMKSRADTAPVKLKVAIFSKHLLFLHGADLPEAAAKIGFDGIDLAVRKGGHVAPERVKEDLPALVATIREHHLEVPMLTTDIADVDTPHCEDILRAMSELGIKHYRWGGFK
jgi:L-ribulose-5-phosphate 3-epimerase